MIETRSGAARPGEVGFGRIRRGNSRNFQASSRSIVRGNLDLNVPLNARAERFIDGTEEANRIRGQRAAGKSEGGARANRGNDEGVSRLLPAGDGLARRAADTQGEIKSGSRKRYGCGSGNGGRSDRERP